MNKVTEGISIPIEIEGTEKMIKQLEKIKELLKEIKDLNIGFDIKNIIEADNNTILLFNHGLMKKEDEERQERELTDKLKTKCVLLPFGTKFEKAVHIGVDYGEKRDYTTEVLYSEGQIVKEITTQYK